ncbi:MAG: hypothetical protein COY40_01835 [Alphaproteobacteria bacterium CG_4_10_14_0_8_um_filter_53_9]|nr:MAG: hypothetical protein COY40_01835 [Alphaproteobacteria bacterium CG_4_10_14_0_8_um_filter_53_9]
MTTPLSDHYTADEIGNLLRSWLAFSATNIMFDVTGKVPRLLLGLRKAPAASIPEPGAYSLGAAGFNTVVPGPAMLEDVANAHAKAQLGIELNADQCSPFLPCEYTMADISDPLNTLFGPLNIKRVAFDRIVFLDDNQMAALQQLKDDNLHFPEGSKLKAIQFMTWEEFRNLEGTGTLSFPFQVDHVLDGFGFAQRRQLPRMISWI